MSSIEVLMSFNRGVNELNRGVNRSVARQGCNLLRAAVISAVTSQGCCCGNLQIHPLGLGHLQQNHHHHCCHFVLLVTFAMLSFAG